jgi:DNA mismatch endonuclease (patch repair protein)
MPYKSITKCREYHRAYDHARRLHAHEDRLAVDGPDYRAKACSAAQLKRFSDPAERERMSVACEGRVSHPLTAEHRAAVGAASKARAWASDSLAKLSVSQKLLWADPQRRRHISRANKGHAVSAANRAAIAAANRLRGCSPATRAKISAANTGRKCSLTTRTKMVAARAGKSFPVNDTKPERAIQAWLSRNGVRFARQFRLRGIAHAFDIAVPRLKTLIEVDGCYWHACPLHCPMSPRRRDTAPYDIAALKRGWTVAHIWEHDIGLVAFNAVAKAA